MENSCKVQYMPTLITKPTKIEENGDKIKIVEEYIGLANSKNEDVSIALMQAPAGWKDIGQCPEFDEFAIVLRGILQVEFKGGVLDVNAGQAAIMHKGEWIRYNTPSQDGVEYISVCLPAFSLEKVHKDKR